MNIKFFSDQKDFRKWLEKNHEKELELIVGFHRVDTGKKCMTWSESVDQAICFGWIDGIRRKIDGESYSIRFTPRKPRSNWSAVNIKKVEELTAKGLMKPAGNAAFRKRDEKRSRIYSYEREHAKFTPAQLKEFKTNKNAWTFFSNQPPYYKKMITYWVVSAKREATRKSRLEKLIKASESGERL
ncbi:MAG: YdeI/OmpD-associated family protein [Acidobacteria bacterium]|nr:YdeI/OmpD-associated family protein [Acidobacteriota bacterium]